MKPAIDSAPWVGEHGDAAGLSTPLHEARLAAVTHALLASGEVIIPVDPSYYSMQALRKMRETLAVLREKSGHDLVPHVLMANFDTRPLFVRQIMSELEEVGFLYQPHTSAGRIPTEDGFRYYVDRLMDRRHITDQERNIFLQGYNCA